MNSKVLDVIGTGFKAMARAIKQTLNEFVPTMPGMDGQTTHGLPMNENPSLLIVDDDAAIVRLVEHIVSRHLSGLFQVVTFNDPRAALDWIHNNRCDLLISDVEMPGIGGMDLLRAGKRGNECLTTIFLTAHSSWEHVAEAIELGANDYLIKPVDQSTLVKLLRQARNALLNSDTTQCARKDPPVEDSTPAMQLS